MHELLKGGQSVIATSRKPEPLQAELNGTYDAETVNRALVVGLDVSKVEEVKAVLAKAIDKFGRIDIIVNNAGYVSLIVKILCEELCINLIQIRLLLEKWKFVLLKPRADKLKSCFGDQFMFVKR